MAARAAIRDVGRVLDMSYTFCDGISKLIPNKPGQHITIDGAITFEYGPIRNTDTPSSRTEAMKINSHAATRPGRNSGSVTVATGAATDLTLSISNAAEFVASDYQVNVISPTQVTITRLSDGTRVPVDVVRHRDTAVDGTAMLCVYGYGSYESSVPPYFSVARLSLPRA